MTPTVLLAAVASLLAASASCERHDHTRSPPAWSSTYTVEGLITIPFAEIREPFIAYADLEKGKSRVDYYGGMDQTYQRADIGKHGTMFKLVPETSETIKNQIECFKVLVAEMYADAQVTNPQHLC